MNLLKILVCIALILALLTFLIAYISYRMVFYVPRNRKSDPEKITVPSGEIYEPYHEKMIHWIKEARAMEHEEFTITSFDGLKLHANYYEYAPDAPMEIMFHGYRSNSERDLSGGIQRCFALGRNVLLIDQRTSRGSEGHVISFGINEHKDCLAWVDFAVKHFGPDVQIILTGISMGASTVMMAAGKPLPSNVKGVLADCGYSSPREIIQKCANQIHIPGNLIYPFIKLGARVFGHFDLEEYSPMEAMKTCRVPIIFIHGETDDFVPCDMSRRLYEACSAPKRLLTVPDAGHGLGFLVDLDGYFKAVTEFFTENGVPTQAQREVLGMEK